ncbi:5-formyltetrahydrofolate cyclo-ligase [Sporichthya sp.]|uniref:5-formyltetrahydrofolate cyclo-ligase n=1 Tax=Sporichthya sp. TaxID=65475 RepID=UPI0017C7E528|nr:5-formyltetrahydrofolate cyclo-ligase [Sporichthya sp.]MBA3743384.1 5-formyltetrahydrofolate cyclo-ligase [Sporichthya sp.]
MPVGGSTGSPTEVDAAKSALRATVLAARRALGPTELAAAAAAIRDRALEALAPAPTVALYASTGTEPGTHPLLEALRAIGTRVLLPVLLEDNGLDWGVYRGPDFLVPGPRGTLEPAGPRLGPEAFGEALLAFVPGLAADRNGRRLGRGGGSYDRTLRHAHPAALIAVVLYPGEIIDTVPARGHDAEVHAVLSPEGLVPVGEAADAVEDEESW